MKISCSSYPIWHQVTSKRYKYKCGRRCQSRLDFALQLRLYSSFLNLHHSLCDPRSTLSSTPIKRVKPSTRSTCTLQAPSLLHNKCSCLYTCNYSTDSPHTSLIFPSPLLCPIFLLSLSPSRNGVSENMYRNECDGHSAKNIPPTRSGHSSCCWVTALWKRKRISQHPPRMHGWPCSVRCGPQENSQSKHCKQSRAKGDHKTIEEVEIWYI